MNRFRIFLVPAILLAMATAVQAQTSVPPVIFTGPLSGVEAQPESGCPAASWYFQAYQESAAALQRVRAMCAAGQAASCCEAKASAGAVKACEAGQAPKACCCAKACACCETCKTKKDTAAATCEWNPFATVRVMPQPVPATPMARPMPMTAQAWPTLPPGTGAPFCLPPQCGSGVVQIVPVQGMNIIQVAMSKPATPVHLVTPDLDARCEHMHHRGDVMVLEGNVLLLVKKHAQPIRIEAQRVLVNMRDGSFTVESDARTINTTDYGVMRTSGVEVQNVRYQIQMTTPPGSAPRAIPVQAAPSTEQILPPASAPR